MNNRATERGTEGQFASGFRGPYKLISPFSCTLDILKEPPTRGSLAGSISTQKLSTQRIPCFLAFLLALSREGLILPFCPWASGISCLNERGWCFASSSSSLPHVTTNNPRRFLCSWGRAESLRFYYC